MPPTAALNNGLAAVILAAGRSTRMGRPKMLLAWERTTVIGHLLHRWQGLGAQQIAVVCAEADGGLQMELERLGFDAGDRISNPNPERGMFSSVRCAAGWNGWRHGLTHWAIVLGDQPHVGQETLQTLLQFSGAHPQHICLPLQGGHRRHPVIMPKGEFVRLAGSTETDLKQVLDARRAVVEFCKLEDPGLSQDMDWPEDYQRMSPQC